MNGLTATGSYKVAQLTLDRSGKNYTAGKEFDTQPSARDFVDSRGTAEKNSSPTTRSFEHSNYDNLDFGSISSRSSSMTSLSSLGSSNSSFPYSSVSERADAASPCPSVGSCVSVKSMKKIQLGRPRTKASGQTLRTCWSSMNNEPYHCDETDDDDSSVTAESCPGDVSIERPSSPHGGEEFRTPSPARTVVGVYSHDSDAKPQSCSLQKKRVISQAVFPHEQDQTLATPLLRLKRVKTAKLKCSGCSAIFNVRDDGQQKVQVNPLCWFCNKKRQSARNRAKKTDYMSRSKENIHIQSKPQKKKQPPAQYPIKRITREEYEREKAENTQKAQAEVELNLKPARQKEKPAKIQEDKSDKKEPVAKTQPEKERSVSRLSISTSSRVRKPRTPSPAPSMERPRSSQSVVRGYEIIDATMIPPLLDSRSFTPVFEDPVTQEPEPRPRSSLQLNYPKSENYLSAPDYARPKSSLERLETWNDSEFPKPTTSKDAGRKETNEMMRCTSDCGVNKLVAEGAETSSTNQSWNVLSEGQSSVSTSKIIYKQEEKVCHGNKQATEVIAKRTEEVEVVQSVLRREVCSIETTSSTTSDLASCKEMPLRNNGRVVIISRRVPARSNQNVSRIDTMQRNETGNVQRVEHVISERMLERSAVSSSLGRQESSKTVETKPAVSSVKAIPQVVPEKKIERTELRSDIEKATPKGNLSEETKETVSSAQRIPHAVSTRSLERTEATRNVEKQGSKTLIPEEGKQKVSAVQTSFPNVVSEKKHERTKFVSAGEIDSKPASTAEETNRPQVGMTVRKTSHSRNFTSAINFPVKTGSNVDNKKGECSTTISSSTTRSAQGDNCPEEVSTSSEMTSGFFNDQLRSTASGTDGKLHKENVERKVDNDFVVTQREDTTKSTGKITRISRAKTPLSPEKTETVEAPHEPIAPVIQETEFSINISAPVKISLPVARPHSEEKGKVQEDDKPPSEEQIEVQKDDKAHVAEQNKIEKEDSKTTKMVKIQTKTSKTSPRDSGENQPPRNEQFVPPVIVTTPAPPSPVENLPLPVLRNILPGMERTASPKRVTFSPKVIQEDLERPGSRIAVITTPKPDPVPVSETKIETKMAPIQENAPSSQDSNFQCIPSTSCRSPAPNTTPMHPKPKKKKAAAAAVLKSPPKPPTTNKMVIIKTVTSRLLINQKTDEVKEEIVKNGSAASKAKNHHHIPLPATATAPPVPPRRGASLNRVSELESKAKKSPSASSSVQRRVAPEKTVNHPQPRPPSRSAVFSARRATPDIQRSDNSASTARMSDISQSSVVTTQEVARGVAGLRSGSALYGAKAEAGSMTTSGVAIATDANKSPQVKQAQQSEQKKPISFAHVSKSPKPVATPRPTSTVRPLSPQDFFRPVPPRRVDSLQKPLQKPAPNLDVDSFRFPPHNNRVCTPDISGREEVNKDGVSVRITRVKTPLPGQKVVISNKQSSNEGQYLQ